MIKSACIFCDCDFTINTYGELKDHDGATLDCPECEKAMVIKDGKLEDFNAALKKSYAEMGMEIDESKDYTQSYIEV